MGAEKLSNSSRSFRWEALAAAGVAMMAGTASAGDLSAFGSGLASDPVALETGSLEVAGPDGELGLHQYYPPPPRTNRYYRPTYRYYRPSWRLRVAPPPIFAPGWFGLYFFANPPPPPAPPAATTPPPPEPESASDFRHVGEYSLSLSAGAYTSEYALTGESNPDPGVRAALRYRNAPALGAELSIGSFGSSMRFDGMGSDQRLDIPIQMSAMLFAFPKAPIQPYVMLGATGNLRTYQYMSGNGTLGDPYTEFRVGPHVGIGLELHIGDNMSVSVDGRRVLYTMVDRAVIDQTSQRDGMVTGGLNFFF